MTWNDIRRRDSGSRVSADIGCQNFAIVRKRTVWMVSLSRMGVHGSDKLFIVYHFKQDSSIGTYNDINILAEF